MRKFEVGQRVRVISCREFPQHVGNIYAVRSVDQKYWTSNGAIKRDGVEVDAKTLHQRRGFPYAIFSPNHLAPIDDGHEKTTWAEMRKLGLWVPEGSEA